ncbi:hypothetical protein IFM89_029995 [Coptis chinensis]|uniref:Protein FAR1-RELATED SEQUENCE n=1 Tax=Coptis chinensis TaxID=261450 RepID=A0A835IGF6_9MAGN|nr:hypothetical protein IFM89_029995 [Coptis chinensis]
MVNWVQQVGRGLGMIIVTGRSDLNTSGRTPRIYLECQRSDRCVNFGEKTTNRAEGAHASLKRRLNGRKNHTFLDMWELIHPNVVAQVIKIRASLEQSLNNIRHAHRIILFSEIRGFVLRKAMDLLLEERERCENVGSSAKKCGCVLRRTHGLPCAHSLNGLFKRGEKLTMNLIHPFWKKLSTTPNPIDRGDLDYQDEFALFVDHYQNSSADQKKKIVTKIEGNKLSAKYLVDPSSNKSETKRKTGGSEWKDWALPRVDAYTEAFRNLQLLTDAGVEPYAIILSDIDDDDDDLM